MVTFISKKSPSYRAESTVSYESNPWALRHVVNSEYNLLLTLRILEILNKLSEKNNGTPEELQQSVALENELREFLKNRSVDNKFDLNYFKGMS